MAIQNFELQTIIQEGLLEKEFHDGLESTLAFADVADVESFPINAGETITKTKTGLMQPVTTPLNPANNVGLDNGLVDSKWSVEQYTLTINHYAATTSLNMVQQHVAIANIAMQNSKKLAIQAKQSMDRLAQFELFDKHMAGNTRVKTTLGAPSATVAVDDIRGFEKVYLATGAGQGVMVPVSVSNPLTVTIGGNSYSLVGVTADGSNTSSVAFNGGKSGVLTLSSNVSVVDGTANQPVVASTAPSIVRAGNRSTTAGLIATDLLKIQDLLRVVAIMRSNNVPDINGAYNCYISAMQLLELWQDGEFQMLYRGQFGAEAYKKANIFELAGIRFITTTELAPQNLNGVSVKRAIVCGQGALVEGRFAGLEMGTGNYQGDGVITIKDGIAFIVREPLDRLQQQVAMSWSTIKGYACPTDVLANSSFIPTATNSYHKRAIIVESA
jgi:hypothetical protein